MPKGHPVKFKPKPDKITVNIINDEPETATSGTPVDVSYTVSYTEPAVSVPFSTVSLKVTDALNKKGIHPVAATGNPMVYTYALKDSDAINQVVKEAGL